MNEKEKSQIESPHYSSLEKKMKLDTEIDELESLEVKGIMKEYSMTVEDFRKLISSQQPLKTELSHAQFLK